MRTQSSVTMTHVFDEARERETLVARKGPDLAAGGGDAGDCTDHGEQNQDGGHEGGGGY